MELQLIYWCKRLTMGVLTKTPEKRGKESGKWPPSCRRIAPKVLLPGRGCKEGENDTLRQK